MNKPLSHFADIHYGKSPSGVIAVEGTVPVYGTGGAYERATRSLFNGPAVVVPRKGSLGSPHYVEGPFWPSDTTYAVMPKAGVDARWLFLQLSLFDLTKLNEATGVPSISRDWLAKTPMFEHNGAEQAASADIVFGVAAQITQTEALIAKQERIRAGLLQDLFTRGVDQNGALRLPREEAPDLYHQTELGWLPKGWDAKTFEQLFKEGAVIEIQDGNHGELHPRTEDFVQDGIAFVMANDLSHGSIVIETCAKIPLSLYRSLRIGFAKAGDVLLSHKGTVGRVARLPLDAPDVMLTPQVTYYRTRQSLLDANFLYAYMNSEHYQGQLARVSAQSTRAYVGLLQQKQLRCIVPASPEQEKLAELLLGFEALQRAQRDALAKSVAIKSALMQDLLTGRVSVAPLLQAQAA